MEDQHEESKIRKPAKDPMKFTLMLFVVPLLAIIIFTLIFGQG